MQRASSLALGGTVLPVASVGRGRPSGVPLFLGGAIHLCFLNVQFRTGLPNPVMGVPAKQVIHDLESAYSFCTFSMSLLAGCDTAPSVEGELGGR